MATREENLKKINAELEQLSDEELENVVGGVCYETADDSRFLNVLLKDTKYYRCDRYGATKMFFSAAANTDVVKSWSALGISLDYDQGLIHRNVYYKDGKEITREQAWEHAEKVVGKHLTKEQWNW